MSIEEILGTAHNVEYSMQYILQQACAQGITVYRRSDYGAIAEFMMQYSLLQREEISEREVRYTGTDKGQSINQKLTAGQEETIRALRSSKVLPFRKPEAQKNKS